MNALDSVLVELERDFKTSIERLCDWLRIPSISADPASAGHCRNAALWILDELRRGGFTCELLETPRNPVVYARFPKPGVKRILFYGHYDVQPPDPLELWRTGPFDPVIQTLDDGTEAICARGAADDKGQVMTFVNACRAWIKSTGTLPFDVTLLIEGEEEIGSQNLGALIEAHQDRLGCDLLFVCDTNMWDRKRPAITRSLRGLLQGEVAVRCSDRDLHSGVFGGVAQNAVQVLCDMLSKVRTRDGAIAIPGFYDPVEEPPSELRAVWMALGVKEAEFLGQVGLSKSIGETDRALVEQMQSRPSFDINGISGGYQGVGGKTIIPSEATAKVSFRLVAGQNPHVIWESFERFLTEQAPVDCVLQFCKQAASTAFAYSGAQDDIEAVATALEATWRQPPVVVGTGVSIPIMSEFKRVLGLDAIMVGFGQEDDRIHSPNEKYDVESFRRGAESWARILCELSSGEKDVAATNA
ncbi:MAG: hypothetical protein BGO03_01675 [Mesorhizobium sp. 61-13]|nr:MAG: hypothetical protein BGO03_01675 [Mesorhizobium sp. 61-13]